MNNNLPFIIDPLNANNYKIFTTHFTYGTYKLDLLLNVKSDILNKYFLYMNVKTGTKKYSFPNMIFGNNPPGERFGPWPNWRFVPDFPKISLFLGDEKLSVKYYFVGDEDKLKILHAFTSITLSKKYDKVIIRIESEEISLTDLKIYNSEKIILSSISLNINETRLEGYPKLLFDNNELDILRRRALHSQWKKIEDLRANWNLKWKITPECRTLKGRERLNILDKLVLSSFYAIITQNPDSILKAKKIFKKYSIESGKPEYEPMRIDTQIGECLFNMCLAYDWLYNYLDETERKYFKEYLFIVAYKLKKFLDADRDDFAQAHFLGCVHGLLAFSFLFYDQNTELKENVHFIAASFSTAMKMLPDDGSYPHGINLWIYEYNFLTRITELLYRFTNLNFWKRRKFWENSSLFRNFSTSPDGLYGITFGDPQYRVCGDASIHYLIASRTGSRIAFDFAEKISDLNVDGVDYRSVTPRRRIWEFIYYTKIIDKNKIVPSSYKYFIDTGQAFIKEKNKLITIKAGPPIGSQKYEKGEWGGYGHSDPSNGAFLIYYNDKFIVTGQESSYKRNTEFYNTVTIDGYGQIGDKMVWAPDFNLKKHFPKIITEHSNSQFSYIEMNLTSCYLEFLKVKKIAREFIYIHPDIFICIDDIRLQNENKIEWNLHSYGKFIFNYQNNKIRIIDKDTIIYLDFINLKNKELKFETGLTPFIPGYPNSGRRDRFLKASVYGKSKNFICLFLLNKNYQLLNYSFEGNDQKWSLKIDYKNKNWILRYDKKIRSIKKI